MPVRGTNFARRLENTVPQYFREDFNTVDEDVGYLSVFVAKADPRQDFVRTLDIHKDNILVLLCEFKQIPLNVLNMPLITALPR